MRRRSRWLLLALGAVVVVPIGLSYPLFVFPPTDKPGRADAVVVFAGADGERQEEGLRLVRDGVAPVLVISDGGLPGSRNARVCRERPAGLRLVCLTPSPATTRGEARAFADLAEREGWSSLVLVTSTYHVRRASLLLGRCYQAPGPRRWRYAGRTTPATRPSAGGRPSGWPWPPPFIL